MPNNITKILIRKGTNADRQAVTFNAGEPAFTTDTQRLYVGDGITTGGIPIGIENFGVIPQLSGSYLRSNLSQSAYTTFALSSIAVGDIVYDNTTTSLYTVTGTSATPALSNFAQLKSITQINTSQFAYNGAVLNIKSNGIGANEINSSALGYGLSGGSGNAITVAAGRITNNLLATAPSNSVKVNNTNNIVSPTDLQIGAGQLLGRTSITGSVLGGVSFSATDGIVLSASTTGILLSARTCLPLAGGTMLGNLSGGTGFFISSLAPTHPNHLVNKSYVDAISAATDNASISAFVRSNFLALTGGTLTGRLNITSGGMSVGLNPISATYTPSTTAELVNKLYADRFGTGNAANSGNGIGVFAYKSELTNAPGVLYFKSLSAGRNISIVERTGTITISGASPNFNPVYTRLTGNGTTVNFVLNGGTSTNPAAYRVDLDGVLQEPLEDYTITVTSGIARIIFDTAPYSGAKIVVVSYTTTDGQGTLVVPTTASLLAVDSSSLNLDFNTRTATLSGTTKFNVVDSPTINLNYNPSTATLSAVTVIDINTAVPVGTVIAVAMNSTPPGRWLPCNGAPVSRTTYSDLFAEIDIVYNTGGEAGTDFRLPDLRGYFIRGHGTNNDGTTSGGSFGRKQADAFKNHQHKFGADDQIMSQGSYTRIDSFAYDAQSDPTGSGGGARTKDDSTNFGGTETRPVNISMLYCIKY
jgi:microcystin-dependent protein